MGYLFTSGLGANGTSGRTRTTRRRSGARSPGLPGRRRSPTSATSAGRSSRQSRRRGKAVDCADLAIQLWIRFGGPRDRDAVQGLGRGREGLEDRQAERLQTVAGFVAWV
jgi:hypothetical protein